MFRKRFFFFYIKRGSSLLKRRKLSLFTYKLSSPGLAGKKITKQLAHDEDGSVRASYMIIYTKEEVEKEKI
jgi:hypothetical protein